MEELNEDGLNIIVSVYPADQSGKVFAAHDHFALEGKKLSPGFYEMKYMLMNGDEKVNEGRHWFHVNKKED